jgi:hypothetical protein
LNVGGRWEAFMTVPSGTTLSATNNGGGPTTVTLTAGSYTATQLCAHVQAMLTAQRAPSGGSWSVALSTGRTGTGLVTISMSTGTFAITWVSTNLRDALGFAGNISATASSTATIIAKGLWFPDCPITIENGDPARAPEMTDTTSTRGPTGRVIGYSSNCFYQHKAIGYSHVAQARVFEGAATAAGYAVGSSWQQWLRDTQWARGHAWFSPCSAFLLYWENAGTESIVGADLNSGAGPTYGWAFDPPLSDLDHVSNASAPWLGLWKIAIPAIVSQG